MSLPTTNPNPPFNVTRASHVTITASDLAKSRAFYEDAMGLVVSDATKDAVYLRGVEEAAHHSLTLKRAKDKPEAERVGMRVYTEDDLDRAKSYFEKAGLPAAWAEVPHQGRTLHVNDPLGTPLEFCATMEEKPRLTVQFESHKSAAPQRIDHYQLLVPAVPKALEFYLGIGFKLSEYVAADGTDNILFIFMQRKGNPHDIVFANGVGPRLHHVAYSVSESSKLFTACDIAGAMGFGRALEHGPGRHGPGHALFTYFRDPDGHRIELFNTHYQMMDIENGPVRWDASYTRNRAWGLPPRASWHLEGARFAGVPMTEPAMKPNPFTLEKFLAETAGQYS